MCGLRCSLIMHLAWEAVLIEKWNVKLWNKRIILSFPKPTFVTEQISSFDTWCDSSIFWLIRSYEKHWVFVVKVVESHSKHFHFSNTCLRGEGSNVYHMWVSTWVLRLEPSITETWLAQLAHTCSSIRRSLRMGAHPITTCLQESGSHNPSVTAKCMLDLELLLEMANI